MNFYLRTRRSLAALFLFVLAVGTMPALADKPSVEGINIQQSNILAVTSGNTLIRFNSATPGTVTTIGAITGLQGGENILGIDFRPATGQLYALGSGSRLYTINRTTAAATFVASLSTLLSGAEFGFDFNPTVDRIRIVSNTGQNLRVNPIDGATIVDGVLNPGTPSVTGAAYTNSFNSATTTTLYDIDSGTDILYTQNPPNNGTLVAVGPLGVNATDVNGFDIAPATSLAYAALTVGITTGLYSINLSNGAATNLGAIGLGLSPIRGLAVEGGIPLPNVTVFGLTTANSLVVFNSTRPNTILRTVPITGLAGGENVIGIDFRPATGQLFAVSSTSRMYYINTISGAALAVGSPGAFALSGTDYGFDFNPTVDRLRVTSDADQNLRLNPNNGTLAATDTPLAYGPSDPNSGQDPSIAGSAYTNNFGGATTTTLYNIDSNLNILTTQVPPNNGTLNTVGALGVDTSANVGFDIAAGSSLALASLQLPGETASKLFTIDLATGSALYVGAIGGTLLRGLAIRGGSASAETTSFDGDRRTDYAVYRPSENRWYINPSSGGAFFSLPFGATGDILAPADYDGDGYSDVAVWRPSNGTFYVLRSSDGAVTSFPWGLNGDEPVVRDYDGDGKADFAVARREGGKITWYINNSANNGFRADIFGLDTDKVAPGDYDGDGRFDLAVRRGTGSDPATFYILRSSLGFTGTQWGLGSDDLAPGDYDGDGRTDLAVVRKGAPYTWYILRSSDTSFYALNFGAAPHVPAQADYDGDGKTDISVFDGAGNFFVFNSSTGATSSFLFGQAGDIPVPGN